MKPVALAAFPPAGAAIGGGSWFAPGIEDDAGQRTAIGAAVPSRRAALRLARQHVQAMQAQVQAIAEEAGG
jgi:hypothetical protein